MLARIPCSFLCSCGRPSRGGQGSKSPNAVVVLSIDLHTTSWDGAGDMVWDMGLKEAHESTCGKEHNQILGLHPGWGPGLTSNILGFFRSLRLGNTVVPKKQRSRKLSSWRRG